MFAYEKKLFWEIRLWIFLIPRSPGSVSVKITEQWTEFDVQYFLFYLFLADEPFPCLLKNVSICSTLSCMCYEHLPIMWHSCSLWERKNNNPCNFKDKHKCQSHRNLPNSFTSWKLLMTERKRNHWELLSADWVYYIHSSKRSKVFFSVPIPMVYPGAAGENLGTWSCTYNENILCSFLKQQAFSLSCADLYSKMDWSSFKNIVKPLLQVLYILSRKLPEKCIWTVQWRFCLCLTQAKMRRSQQEKKMRPATAIFSCCYYSRIMLAI